MSRSEIFEKLNEIFRDVFDDESINVNEASTADDIEDWDSLTHITLISTIEDEFNIRFDMKTVLQAKNLGELADAIEEKI